jgi:hypothetical protein
MSIPVAVCALFDAHICAKGRRKIPSPHCSKRTERKMHFSSINYVSLPQEKSWNFSEQLPRAKRAGRFALDWTCGALILRHQEKSLILLGVLSRFAVIIIKRKSGEAQIQGEICMSK